MKTVTLKDITLKAYPVKSDTYLAALKAELLAAPVDICIERAQHITQYMKTQSDAELEALPLISRAKAVATYLQNKKALFPDMNRLAGSTGSKRKSAPVYPEYIGLAIWSELETITTRKANPMRLTKADAETLNKEPDILQAMLNQDIAFTGNINYMNKFGYMAQHLLLRITGGASFAD